MQQGKRFAIATAIGVSIARAASAATVSGSVAAVFQQEALVSGSVSGGGTSTVRVVSNGGGESRGVYEFALPALPVGGEYSSLALAYNVTDIAGVVGSDPQLRFTTYRGDGRYDAADANRASGTLLSAGYRTTGAYVQPLPTVQPTPWLGVNASVVGTNAAIGISRGTSTFLGPAPALTYVASVPAVGTLATTPIVDALVDASTGARVVTDLATSSGINAQESGNIQRRGALEYNLAGLPDGAVVTSASLAFTVDTITSDATNGGPEPRFYGYVANGVAEPADYGQTATLLATGPTALGTGGYSVTLDPAAVRTLLAGGADLFGVLVRGSADGKQFGFSTIEGGSPAELRLTYVTPEPATLAAVVGIGAACGVRRRRR